MPGTLSYEDVDLQLHDLAALLDVSKALSSESDLDKLLHLITGKVTEVLNADRSTLFLYDESTGELWSKIAEQLGEKEIRFPLGVGIAGTVAETRVCENITDPYGDSRFNPAFDKETGFRSRSILCAPMVGFTGNLLGVIQVLNKSGGGQFGRKDESLLEAFASHASVALERARLTGIAMQKQRMDEALKLAREIQMSMLPTSFPPFPERRAVQINAAVKPAREVGGDFYDFDYLDAAHLYFCVGDVSGKGIPASLFMAVTKTLIKSRTTEDRSTASILTYVNEGLSKDNDSSMFVTLFVGILDVTSGELTYTNAGHVAPYLRRRDGFLERLDACHGPLVGAMPGMVYSEGVLSIAPGDLLLLYTDGVTEAMNFKGDLFSETRLLDVIRAPGSISTEDIVHRTVAAVENFEQGCDQTDDITVFSLQFLAVTPRFREFSVRSHLSELTVVNHQLEVFGKQNALSSATLSKLRLIFDELMSNVAAYAYPDDADYDVGIRLEIAGSQVRVRMIDEGVPFDPLAAASPDTSVPLGKRVPGGLGIHLVRNLVDEASYERQGEKNVLTLAVGLGPKATGGVDEH